MKSARLQAQMRRSRLANQTDTIVAGRYNRYSGRSRMTSTRAPLCGGDWPIRTDFLENTMGLLDQLAGQVLGAVGGQQDPVPQSALLAGVMALVNSAGGLPGLLQKFQASGMGDQVASWIGHGENQSISGAQINDALGEDAVAQVAQHAGIAPEHAANGLAQLLPQIIDKLTPNGQMPDNALLQEGLGLLKGKLFG
jgi:uncharacterized protein YidB (DUF937 family)